MSPRPPSPPPRPDQAFISVRGLTLRFPVYGYDAKSLKKHLARVAVGGRLDQARHGSTTVTAITGLEAPEAELKTLLKQLKATCGTGGTLKEGVIELQGDQVAVALGALEKAGYRPKQAGG